MNKIFELKLKTGEIGIIYGKDMELYERVHPKESKKQNLLSINLELLEKIRDLNSENELWCG